MLFHSPAFLLFFLILFCAYWLLRSNRKRKTLLLLASYVFYAHWDWRFLFLILLSTFIDYFTGKKMARTKAVRTRRYLLLFSLATNLSLLGFFKYFNFFADSFVLLANQLGTDVSYTTLNIILPVGISFYTFQTLSYTIDLYKRQIPREKSFLDFALFVAFFPQLVAGPIVRAIDFLPQLKSTHRISAIPWRSCLLLFMFGLIKKVVFADNIALIIDPVFSRPDLYNSPTVIFAAFLFAIQIYCDFSGYTDMAIACAKMFGYDLPMNFFWPYLAKNVSDFWRRWHMSLSYWFRDYVYIPLGGNRKGGLAQNKNLLITMLVAGLWHGAAFTFIIWGFLHGVALIVYHFVVDKLPIRAIRVVRGHKNFPIAWPVFISLLLQIKNLLCVIGTFWFICLCWLFFRAESVGDAFQLAQTYLFLDSGKKSIFSVSHYALFCVLTTLHYLTYRYKPVQNAEKIPTVRFGFFLGGLAAFYFLFQPVETQPFIYFQF